MRLIAVDLDDTLLHRDKTISPYTLDVLNRCRSKGMRIAFATARSEHNAEQHIAKVRPDAVISSGGALTRFHGEILDARRFSAEETALLIAAARALSGDKTMITVDTQTAHYENYRDAASEDPDWGATVHTDFADFRTSSLKICVSLPAPEDAAKIAAALPDCEWLRFFGTDWYRFTKAGVSKESALAALGAKLGIPMKDMIAFGDDYGDIGMIQACGLGVAMQNAIPEVRAAADNICEDCDQDGVARELERRFLAN